MRKHPAGNYLRQRSGNVMVLIAILLPALFGMLGLIYDASTLMYESRQLQQIADAAATSAAKELQISGVSNDARAMAVDCIEEWNNLDDATVTVNIPPTTGPYIGQANYVEVIVNRTVPAFFIQVVGISSNHELQVRSVAGFEDATGPAAIVALDPEPEPLTLSAGPPMVLGVPINLGGVEVLGLGEAEVAGAVLVNNRWEGVDEHGDPAGVHSGNLLGGLQHGVSCTPLLGLTCLACTDLRVCGGVDDLSNYSGTLAGNPTPVQAGRLPVPDPFAVLPVPTLTSDPANVSGTERGGVRVAELPLLSLPVTLRPGVYDWIEIISGKVQFDPGVYIIRGTNPITGIALNILGGTITAEGVMFYVTNNPSYDPNGSPIDATDGETVPAPLNLSSVLPSVVLNTAVFPISLSPLNSPGSPYDGVLLYQRRADRRPIVLLHEKLILGGDIAGTIYAKWGHVTFIGSGNYDLRFVAGTVRLATVLQMTIEPSEMLPAAQDVFLVE